MKRPLLGLSLTYAAGILAGSQLNQSPLWPGGVALALVVAFICAARSRWSLALLLAAVLSAGAAAYRFSIQNFSPIHITQLVLMRDQNISLRGIIASDPGFREAEGAEPESPGDRHSFTLDLEALARAGAWEPATGRVLVFITNSPEQPPLRYGDEIEFSAILRVPRPATNPGVFDWQQWLARQHIEFTASIRKNDRCQRLASGLGNPVMALSYRLRNHFDRALHLGLETQPELAGVLSAIVIGERSEVPVETYTDFQQTGVFHVFATAGLHVGVVTFFVVTILRLARIQRRWCALIAIPLLVLYVFATGTRPCALRALVMASVWLIGWLLVRPVDKLSVLAAAALALLVWNPTELFDGAFILSFTVVLALVLLTPLIESRLMSWIEPDPFLPRELLPKWRRNLDMPLRWVIKTPSCSLATWIGLLPLMALYFNLFTPVSTLANLIAVPLVGLIIPIGMLSAAAYSFWPALTVTFNNANFGLLSLMINLVGQLGHWNPGHCYVQAPPVGLILLYYAILLVAINRDLTVRVKYWIVGPASALILLVLIARYYCAPVAITVLDLPDGAATVVAMPGENAAFLIDGGGEWSGEHIVLPFLHSRGINQLAAVAVTHADKAHVAGLKSVAQKMPIGLVMQVEPEARSKFAQDWLGTIRTTGLETVTLHAGDERVIGGKLRLRVLNPPAVAVSSRGDDNSLVLLLQYGATRILLAGDIGRSVEQRLVTENADLRAQIIIKGRHGKEPSGTEIFLEAVKPEAVIQSVNTRPGSPAVEPDERDRLRERGLKLYRTDESGAVTIHLQETGYEIQTCLAAGSGLGKEP